MKMESVVECSDGETEVVRMTEDGGGCGFGIAGCQLAREDFEGEGGRTVKGGERLGFRAGGCEELY
jgi:hypothetical protein